MYKLIKHLFAKHLISITIIFLVIIGISLYYVFKTEAVTSSGPNSPGTVDNDATTRSEEHTSELQSH